MRTDYATQIAAIEAEFEHERSDIKDRNEEEIKALFEEHKKEEEKFAKERQDKEKEYEKQLEDVMSQDANTQAEQKIKLEKEMQILQRCMEDMKAVYRLNEEKLDFNHRVLLDRETVNQKQEKALKNRHRSFLDQRRRRRQDFFTDMGKKQETNIYLTNKYKEFTK